MTMATVVGEPTYPRRCPTDPDLVSAPAGALLAVGIANQAGERAGWPSPWRDVVAELREHADPDVRARASRTVTAPE
jgi:hypothetical protein